MAYPVNSQPHITLGVDVPPVDTESKDVQTRRKPAGVTETALYLFWAVAAQIQTPSDL